MKIKQPYEIIDDLLTALAEEGLLRVVDIPTGIRQLKNMIVLGDL